MMKNKKKRESNEIQYMPIGMCMGLSIGMAIGSAFGNLTLGMCVGLSFGMAIGALIDYKRTRKSDEEQDK